VIYLQAIYDPTQQSVRHVT